MHCLIIGKVWPEPDSTAAGRRTLNIIQALQAGGYEVTFATAARQTGHSFNLETLNVSLHKVQANDSAFDSWIAESEPDCVLFDRFMIEEQFGWRVEKACPNALRILDTSDLHCLREARRIQVEDGKALDLYNYVALREIAAIHRSDMTLMIADYEVKLLIAEFGVPERQVAYLPFWVEMDDSNFVPFELRQNFMMIGSFMHLPNVDAIRWCRQAIWPLIREQLPQAEFHCYGSHGDRYRQELHDPDNGFIYKGHAEDALRTLKEYRVNCVPLRYGAGLKGKVFDGFQTGTPTVTTSIGAEGIAGNEEWARIEWSGNYGCQAVLCAEWQTNRFDANEWFRKLPQLLETSIVQLAENRKRNFIGRMLSHHQHRSTEYMSRWIEAKRIVNGE